MSRLLIEEIARIAPAVIVALGATALNGVMSGRMKVGDARSRDLQHPLGARVIATYHPAAVLRAPDVDTKAELMRTLVADLARAATLAAKAAPQHAEMARTFRALTCRLSAPEGARLIITPTKWSTMLAPLRRLSAGVRVRLVIAATASSTLAAPQSQARRSRSPQRSNFCASSRSMVSARARSALICAASSRW